MQQCCTDIKMDVIKELIYRVEQQLAVASPDRLALFLYDYPRRYEDTYLDKLSRYLLILEKLEKSLLAEVSPCFECCDYETLIASLNTLLPKTRIKCEANVLIDESERTAWELAHPFCISRTRWEELAYHVCGAIELTVKTTDLACDFTFDISTETLSCDTVATLSVYQKLCDLDFTMNRTDEECKIDFQLLIEKHPDCGVTFRSYKRLLDCNMSFDIINQILCDTSSIYFKNGLPTIKTALGEYTLGGDLFFNAVIAPSDCANTLCKTTGSCTLDSASFYGRLLSDYNLTDAEKAAILEQIN